MYLAARSRERAESAIKRLKAQVSEATIEWLELDLSAPLQVRDAARNFMKLEKRLDILGEKISCMIFNWTLKPSAVHCAGVYDTSSRLYAPSQLNTLP